MKKILFVLIMIALCANIFAMDVVLDKKPAATIVLGSDATDIDRYACDEFIKYAKKITGATISVSPTPTDGNNIYIGTTQVTKDFVKSQKPSFDWNSLKSDGILVFSKGNNLVLAGDNSGTIYAVYTFFEEVCGVVFAAYDTEYVPKRKNIKIKDIFYAYKSPFMSRECFCAACNGKWEYDLKMKLNGHTDNVPDNLGGHVVLNGFAHTFNTLINPDVYGKDHPEWYCMRGGARMANPLSQPCLTNKEMVRELIKNVIKTIEANPNDKIISVTQNDTQNYCTCPECTALTEKYGHSGALLTVVNQVADAIKDKYPDKYIETFAYQYTREAPKGGIVPKDNVIIRLCSIECDFGHPFDHPNNKDFYKDLKDWKSITKNLYVWDYISNFADYVIIHPNLQVLETNMQIMAENNVIAVFEEGDYTNTNSCLYAYKMYMTSKILWDPYLNFTKESMKFLRAYYGPAADYMAQFIYDSARPFFRKKQNPTLLTFMHNNSYYTAKDWIRCFSDLDMALAAAKNDKTYKVGKRTVKVNEKMRQKYYERVYLDMLCFNAGYTGASAKIKKQVEKTRVQPFRDYKSFIKAINEFAPSHGIINASERNSFETGLYATPSYKKTGPKPDMCENFPDENWIDWQNSTLNKIYHNNKYAMTFDDPMASNGKSIWCNSKYDLRYIQKELTNLYLDESIKSGDFYVVYRIDPNAENKTCFYAGVTNDKKGDIFKFEFKANDTPDNKYITQKVGTVDFKNTTNNTYFWIGGSGDETATTGMYIDRVFVILNR